MTREDPPPSIIVNYPPSKIYVIASFGKHEIG